MTDIAMVRMLEERDAEIERLRAALKEAGMLVEATAAYYPSIPYKPRLDACLLEIRALEPKPSNKPSNDNGKIIGYDATEPSPFKE